MKRMVMAALLLALPYAAPRVGAQETANQRAEKEAQAPVEAHSEGLIAWKWANFVLLAGTLGWLVKKHAGPYFASRSLQIRKDMIEAGDIRQRAEARAAEVERRLAGLGTDIAALRTESVREAEAERERLTRQTAAEIAKMQQHTEEQIAAAAKAARMELRRYSVELAIGLARQKIQARITPETQDALVRGFVRHLEAPGTIQNS